MARSIALATVGLLLWAVVGCGDLPKRKLITIKYSRAFEIAGTDKKGLSLKGLAVELHKLAEEHPESEYEVLSDKVAPEDSDKIIKVILESGVKLKHYWASYSDSVDTPPGPYGPGYIDLLGLEEQGDVPPGKDR